MIIFMLFMMTVIMTSVEDIDDNGDANHGND
jgi:hypothetical protein